ncbi:hypothetical protein [Nocardia testacea]|uniref:hypothetical protein n=1 Tax=Nocardia testacea TaxID=248551 RepID=UPI003A87046C
MNDESAWALSAPRLGMSPDRRLPDRRTGAFRNGGRRAGLSSLSSQALPFL